MMDAWGNPPSLVPPPPRPTTLLRVPKEGRAQGFTGGSHASALLRAKDSTKNLQRIPQRVGSRRPPPFVEAAAGRLPLWMGLAGAQASSSKQQASIGHQAASIKHQAASIQKLVSETLARQNMNRQFL